MAPMRVTGVALARPARSTAARADAGKAEAEQRYRCRFGHSRLCGRRPTGKHQLLDIAAVHRGEVENSGEGELIIEDKRGVLGDPNEHTRFTRSKFTETKWRDRVTHAERRVDAPECEPGVRIEVTLRGIEEYLVQ